MDFKNVISFAAGCAGIAAFAGSVPEVTVTEFSQADDRTVTVKYSLVNAPAVVTMDVETNGPSGWVSIGGEAICGTYGAAPTGDVWKKIDNDGTDYKITWHPDLTWADHKITDNNARVVVTAWALDNTPDYMAINLASSGDDAIRYYPGAGFVPGGVLGNKAYRTTSLLMRKIMAKGVTYTMGASATETYLLTLLEAGSSRSTHWRVWPLLRQLFSLNPHMVFFLHAPGGSLSGVSECLLMRTQSTLMASF